MIPRPGSGWSAIAIRRARVRTVEPAVSTPWSRSQGWSVRTQLEGGEQKYVQNAARTIRRRIVEIDERHNDPGRFTTLGGIDWTPTTGGANQPRVIIFRGNDVPEVALSGPSLPHPSSGTARRIETTVLGDRMSVARFAVDGRTLGARDDEAGYIHHEVYAMG